MRDAYKNTMMVYEDQFPNSEKWRWRKKTDAIYYQRAGGGQYGREICKNSRSQKKKSFKWNKNSCFNRIQEYHSNEEEKVCSCREVMSSTFG